MDESEGADAGVEGRQSGAPSIGGGRVSARGAGGEPLRSARELLEALGRQPGAEQLLALAPKGAYLVGGAVRDLLLGRAPRELDVVLTGGDRAGELAERLRSCVGADRAAIGEHESFGTATVEWDGARIDFARARRECYAAPGALPAVEPATLDEDLLRRDFTVNAIAVALGGARRGELRAAPQALEDLRAGRLRVLHERSFLDDPTRLWRLARYRARLGFVIEERTAALAAQAVAAGALATVSGARLGAELRLVLVEPDPLAALAELQRLGVLEALHPQLRLEQALVQGALALLASRGAQDTARTTDRADLLILAALALPLALRADGEGGLAARRAEIAALLDRLEFAAGARDRVAAATAAVPELIDELPAAARPSQLRDVAMRVPPEGVALAGALSTPAAAPARRWLEELRYVRLRIGGADLLAAGIPEGPQIGWRLEQTLRGRLDGELPDERAAQLRAALALG